MCRARHCLSKPSVTLFAGEVEPHNGSVAAFVTAAKDYGST
jgi:hypothetical protein